MADLPEISDETMQQLATVMHRELEASDPLGGWHFGCIGSVECGKGERAHELLAEDVLPALLAALVASGWRPEADVRREVQRSLSLAGLAALRCIPDGEIRNGCVIHDGAKVRERFRQAYLAITAEQAMALDPAQPLPVADGYGIERESIEDAQENDRCGICGSVEHFREDHRG